MPTGLRTHNRMSPLLAPATAFWTRGLQRAAAEIGASPLGPAAPNVPSGVSRPGSLGRRMFVSRAQAPSSPAP